MRKRFNSGSLILILFILIIAQATVWAQSSVATTVDWSVFNNQIAIGYSDGTLEIRDATGILINTFDVAGEVHILHWSPTDNRLAGVSTSSDGFNTNIWTLDSLSGSLIQGLTGEFIVGDLDWSPDGTKIVSTDFIGMGSQNLVHIWNALPGQLQTTDALENYTFFSVDWHPTDQKWIALAEQDGTLAIWDTQLDTLVSTTVAGIDELNTLQSISWNPAGNRIATVSYSESIQIWSWANETLTSIATFPDDPTTFGAMDIQWSPDGTRIAIIDGSVVRIVNAETGGEIETTSPITFLNSATWNPNSSQVVYVGRGDEIESTVWEIVSASPAVTCNFSPANVGDLRTVIGTANGNGTPDTICLNPTGNYTMTDAPSGYNADGSNGLPSITSDITIIGNGGTATIARGTTATNFRLLRVATGGSLTLNNVIVQGGNAASTAGGGIRNLGTLNLINSTVQNNAAAGGAGIYNLNGTVNLSAGSIVSNNTSSANGGGIRNNGGTLTIANSTISNNVAATASSNGGGIYNNGGGLTIQGSTTISGNSARLGGGVYVGDTGASTATIDMGVGISSNTVVNNGGGVYINSGTVTIGNASGGLVTVSSNVATNSGSGIYQAGGTLTLRYCTVSNNGSSTASSGGGLRAEGTLMVNNCSFTNNLVKTSTGLGAGIYINAAAVISVTNTTISNIPGTAAARNGAGMFVTGTATVTISGSNFTGNRAQNIGGALFLDLGNTANISTTTFNNNSAVSQGGAIANYGTLTLTTSNLTNNNGGSYGGALVNDNSTTGDSVSQTCVTGNTATNGSAMYSFSATFNTENNWWGSTSGAGTSVNSNVDAAPFLSSCPNP